MALELHEGGYALQQGGSKKSVIQIKLTDSALRAIETYEDDFQMRRREKPNICFNGNQGIIQIPSSDRNETQRFQFQFSSLNQSAFIHCLQQHVFRSSSTMSVLGEIQHKVTINATDDSYNATKKRMEIVKELEKNISTKVIKQPSGSKLGKKQFLRRKVLDQASGGSQFSNSRTSTPPLGRSSHNLSRSVSPLIPSARSASPVSGRDLAGVRNKTKPILSSISTSKAHPSAARPLQERILHILALRPIQVQDLMMKLNRGAPSVDRTRVQTILQQIATNRSLRANGTEYSLKKHLYCEVQSDWIGYSDEEKAFITRKLADDNFGSSNEVRNRPIRPNQAARKAPTAHPNKRELDEETYQNPVKKKARVSLYNKTSPNLPRPRSVSPLEKNSAISFEQSPQLLKSSAVVALKDSEMDRLGISSSTLRVCSPKRPLSANSRATKEEPNESKRISPLTTSLLPPSDSFSSTPFNTVTSEEYSSKTSPSDFTNSLEDSRKPLGHRKNDSQPKSYRRGDDVDLPDARNPLSSDIQHKSKEDEFVKKYKPINYAEERDRYKRDFSAEYKEYLALHQKVVSQLKLFAEWQNELSQQQRNTDTYKQIARKVYAEYQRLNKDKKFYEERERRDYLHRKLKHIKKLVLEYDSKQFARHNAGRQAGTEGESNPHCRPNDVTHKRAVISA